MSDLGEWSLASPADLVIRQVFGWPDSERVGLRALRRALREYGIEDGLEQALEAVADRGSAIAPSQTTVSDEEVARASLWLERLCGECGGTTCALCWSRSDPVLRRYGVLIVEGHESHPLCHFCDGRGGFEFRLDFDRVLIRRGDHRMRITVRDVIRDLINDFDATAALDALEEE